MSAAADSQAVAVVKPGHCKREVLIGKKKHVVKHSWRIHVCEVELVTTLLGEKYPHRTLNKKTSYVMNTEEALSSKGEEMAECVLKNRRDQFMRLQQQQQTGGRGSSSKSSGTRGSKRKTSSADSGVTCPIISALRGGGDVAGKASSEVVKKPPADPPAIEEKDIGGLNASPSFVAAMKSMTAEGFLRLMESHGMKGAAKLRQERQEGRELQAAMKSALADAKVHGRTVEGRRAFQTILTAAAYDAGGGKDASVRDGYRPSTNPVTAKRMAEILDVHPDFFSVARKRAKRLRADIPPSAAINEGAYWYQPRLRRCDAASPELMQMMERFWHTEGVSRPSRDPYEEEDLFRGPDSPGYVDHPRRELVLPRGGEAVYAKFLGWAEYLRFKGGQAEDFTDPGRTLFLSTRCKCLAVPTTRTRKPAARVQD
ncbi:unnamed protein product [Laminaria digitata]